MVRCAIVEDESVAAETLASFIERYSEETGTAFSVTKYDNAVTFLTEYRSNFEIVFMDIELPMLNGMDASFELRKKDPEVVLIFVTNMAQFAVQGYEVGALNFIVKPVSYFNFAQKLSRAMHKVELLANDEIPVKRNKTVMRIKARDIKYVEVLGHELIYHGDNVTYNSPGSLKDAESALSKFRFARCNNCYLVNLRYVTEIKNYTVIVGGEVLKISRPKRKDFVRAMNEYLAEGGR